MMRHIGRIVNGVRPVLFPMKTCGRRSLFIQTQDSPNPNSMLFLPGCDVTGDGAPIEFKRASESHKSPLAVKIFRIEGVVNVLYGRDFVSVTKKEDMPWELLKPQVFGELTDFFMSGEELITDAVAPEDTAINPDDSEIVIEIKELLDSRIRPMVHEDGGDIEYVDFTDGIVYLKMKVHLIQLHVKILMPHG